MYDLSGQEIDYNQTEQYQDIGWICDHVKVYAEQDQPNNFTCIRFKIVVKKDAKGQEEKNVFCRIEKHAANKGRKGKRMLL